MGCVEAFCGDGHLQVGVEECDEGDDNSDTEADACRTSCRRPFCGDDVVDSGELCDDGNNDDGDACDALCQTPAPICQTCGHLRLQHPDAGSGLYTIDPDGEGGVEPFEVYCDMGFPQSGLTLVSNRTLNVTPSETPEAVQPGQVDNAITAPRWQAINAIATSAVGVDTSNGQWVEFDMAAMIERASCSPLSQSLVEPASRFGDGIPVYARDELETCAGGCDYSMFLHRDVRFTWVDPQLGRSFFVDTSMSLDPLDPLLRTCNVQINWEPEVIHLFVAGGGEGPCAVR